MVEPIVYIGDDPELLAPDPKNVKFEKQVNRYNTMIENANRSMSDEQSSKNVGILCALYEITSNACSEILAKTKVNVSFGLSRGLNMDIGFVKDV